MLKYCKLCTEHSEPFERQLPAKQHSFCVDNMPVPTQRASNRAYPTNWYLLFHWEPTTKLPRQCHYGLHWGLRTRTLPLPLSSRLLVGSPPIIALMIRSEHATFWGSVMSHSRTRLARLWLQGTISHTDRTCAWWQKMQLHFRKRIHPSRQERMLVSGQIIARPGTNQKSPSRMLQAADDDDDPTRRFFVKWWKSPAEGGSGNKQICAISENNGGLQIGVSRSCPVLTHGCSKIYEHMVKSELVAQGYQTSAPQTGTPLKEITSLLRQINKCSGRKHLHRLLFIGFFFVVTAEEAFLQKNSR